MKGPTHGRRGGEEENKGEAMKKRHAVEKSHGRVWRFGKLEK